MPFCVRGEQMMKHLFQIISREVSRKIIHCSLAAADPRLSVVLRRTDPRVFLHSWVMFMVWLSLIKVIEKDLYTGPRLHIASIWLKLTSFLPPKNRLFLTSMLMSTAYNKRFSFVGCNRHPVWWFLTGNKDKKRSSHSIVIAGSSLVTMRMCSDICKWSSVC